MAAGPFSEWPEPLGLAALRDVEAVSEFADIVRQEYLAVGFRVALHPQLDLATEPRWARIAQTFGEDADLAARLGVAYLEGLRGGPSLGPDSVAAMAKHFPGGGPQRDGEDPHFPHGKEQVYPGGMFDYHLRPFQAAIAAGVSQIMPGYGVPIGTEYDEVAFGFNDGVINRLLRTELGFDGIVCSDWGIISDHRIMGEAHAARAWGVEHLSPAERMLMAVSAGVDQFGGESRPELIVELVRSGQLPAARLDQSVRRLLAEKFRLGLFDHRRYVDPELAERTAGKADFRAAGRRAQSASVTVLTNRDRCLPAVSAGTRLFVQGVDPAVAAEYADVVTDPAQADLALLRLSTPYEERPGRFESLFHTGPLDFDAGRLAEILAAAGRRADRRGRPPGAPGRHPRDQLGRERPAGGVRRQRRRPARRRLRLGRAPRPAAGPAAAEHGRRAPGAARCAAGVGRPAVRLRGRAQPGAATIAASTAASLMSARLVAVSSVSGPSSASPRRCASASARSGSSSSCRYRRLNSSNRSGSWSYQVRSSPDGATFLHHSSSAALALLSPRGQSRSTSTRVPSSGSGSSYARRTRTFAAIAAIAAPMS